jgi:hypothetical protein
MWLEGLGQLKNPVTSGIRTQKLMSINYPCIISRRSGFIAVGLSHILPATVPTYFFLLDLSAIIK